MNQYMLGSWEGHEGDRSWCATYVVAGEDTTAEMHIKEPSGKGELAFRHLRKEGFLITSRGRRFQLNIAKTHNNQGAEIPYEKRGGSRSHYFISKQNDDSFLYLSDLSEKIYENKRVNGCDEFEAEFKAYNESLKAKVKAAKEEGTEKNVQGKAS